MNGPSYPAAHLVATRVEAQFARYLAVAGPIESAELTLLPDAAAIESIIDAAFWASLRREEGYVPRISVALLPPAQAERPLLFERSLPLSPAALVRIAPAVERPGIHLGVWRDPSGELRVWGTTRVIPSFCFVLEVSAPGLLVVKHHRGEIGKFANVAVLEGDQVKVIDEQASSLPDCPTLVSSLIAFDATGSSSSPFPDTDGVDGVNVLVQVAVSMRAHGRGGSLLVGPDAAASAGRDAAGPPPFLESIIQPISYAVSPRFAELSELLRHPPSEDRRREWQDGLDEAVAALAGLTAVDGATVITDRYELMAFGAKIARRRGSSPVEQVMVTEPVEGAQPEVVHPTRLGGTRHLSAAQFVHDQRGALALVASQDGRFTVFAWSPCEDMVHAHRVEALLL
jgi:hypothetical protein